MAKLSMKAQIQRTPYCCGLMEIGSFGDPGYAYDYTEYRTKEKPPITKKTITERGYAHICVTKKSQITYIAKLKAWGFKKVGSWKNPNTGTRLILWAYFPKEKERG